MNIKINNENFNIVIANSFFKRLLGLMFKKNINYGMYFKKCNLIHTFFMKENIDLLVLDENNIIVKKIENVKKNKIVNTHIKKGSVLELPLGYASFFKTNKKLF